MAEDYSVQQRPSAAPYVGIGGIAGGVGGYVAADKIKKLKDWSTDPVEGKYKDWDALVNEKDDEFVKNIEKVEDKDLAQKARDARQRIAEETKKWDDDLKSYLEDPKNKGEQLAELPNDHELITKRNGIKENIAKLESATGEATTETFKKEPLSVYRKARRNLSDAGEKLAELKKTSAEKIAELKKNGASAEEIAELKKTSAEKIAKQESYIKELEQRANSVYDKIVEQVKFEGTAEEIKTQKTNFKNSIEEHVQRYLQTTDVNNSVKPDNSYVTATKKLAEATKAKEESLAEIKKLTGYNIEGMNGNRLARRRMMRVPQIAENKVKVLETILEKSENTTGSTSHLGFMDRLENAFRALRGKDPVNFANEKDAMKEFMDSLSAEEKKLLNGDFSKENIEKLLKDAKTNRDAVKEAFAKYGRSRKEINTLNLVINRLKRALKKGQHYNEAGEICVNGKPIKPTVKNPVPALDKAITDKLPKEMEFTRQVTKGAATPEEIQVAKDSLTQVEAEIQKAREALPKVIKDEAALKKEFIEKNGERGVKAVEKVKGEFSEGLAKLFEGGSKTNWLKKGGIIAAGAAALALVALAFRPSSKQA